MGSRKSWSPIRDPVGFDGFCITLSWAYSVPTWLAGCKLICTLIPDYNHGGCFANFCDFVRTPCLWDCCPSCLIVSFSCRTFQEEEENRKEKKKNYGKKVHNKILYFFLFLFLETGVWTSKQITEAHSPSLHVYTTGLTLAHGSKVEALRRFRSLFLTIFDVRC